MLHQTHTSASCSEKNVGQDAGRDGSAPPPTPRTRGYSSTPPCIGHHGPFSSSVRMTGPSAVTATVFS